MRTTISLDDRLLERLKKRAAESGTSVSRIIERAVRLLLQSPAPQQKPEHFDLVTFGAGGHFTTVNVDKTSALIEADDIDRFGKLR
jgi:predicted transcriptional regulator